MCSNSDTTFDHSQRLASWTPPSFGKKEQNDLCDLKCRLKALLHVPYFGLTPVAQKRQYSARIFSVPQCLPLYCIWKEFHGFACETLPPSAKAAWSPVLPDCEGALFDIAPGAAAAMLEPDREGIFNARDPTAAACRPSLMAYSVMKPIDPGDEKHC